MNTVSLALPSSPAAGAVYIALLAVALLIAGLIHSRIWPWAGCWQCRGAGRSRAPGGRSWRDCPRCTGSGRRGRTWSGR